MCFPRFPVSAFWAALWFAIGQGLLSSSAADQPQWGEAWGRNMVSGERDLPEAFDPKTGKHIKWTAALGTETYSTPVIAAGRVYLGTNNEMPRDPKHKGDRGVLLCLEEQTGNFLWQLVVPKREEDPYHDWPKSGLSSTVTVEGNRLYVVSSRGEVMCLDVEGLANGNDGPFQDEATHMMPAGQPALPLGARDADIIWLYDLTKGVGIWSHDAAHSAILVQGPYLYLNSGTGVDNTHRKIRTPEAPSLVVIDKRTGQLVGRDEEGIAPRIFHCTWSGPTLGQINGRAAIFLAAGDGVIYAFEPLLPNAVPKTVQRLKKIWQFDFDPAAPKEEVHRYTTNRREGPSNIYGMPVYQDGLLYVAGGGDWFWGKNEAWLKCIDVNATPGSASALRWSYPLGRHTMATPAVKDGLVYVTDAMNQLHCVDAKSGAAVWTHELNGEMWASAYVADGKVYAGTRRGNFCVLAANRKKELLSSVELVTPISATATAANGTLYVATMTQLFALSKR